MVRGAMAAWACALLMGCGDDDEPVPVACEPTDRMIASVTDDPLVDVAFALGDGVVGVAVHAKGTPTLELRSYDLASGELLAEETVTAPHATSACPPTSPSCRGGMRMAASDTGFAVLWPALVFDDTGFPADPYANNVYLVGFGAGGGVDVAPRLVHPQDGIDLVDATPRAIRWDAGRWLLAWSEVREAPAQMGRIHTFHVDLADRAGSLSWEPAVQVPRAAIVRPNTAIAVDGDRLLVAWLEREGDPTRDDVWLYAYDMASATGRLDALPSDEQTRRSPGLVRVDAGFAFGWKLDDGPDFEVLALNAAAARGDVATLQVRTPGDAYRMLALDGGGIAIVGIAGGELAVAEVGGDGTGLPGRLEHELGGDGVVWEVTEIDGGLRALYTRSSGSELDVRLVDVCW